MNGLWEMVDHGWVWVFIILVEFLVALLIARRIFRIPKFKETVKHSSCDNLVWEVVADFDCAVGFDFDPGRCANCGAYVMVVFYVC